MQRHVTIIVKGKVQGVFFRACTKEKADMLGIKGFVRNEPDGSVHIEAEGEAEAIQQLLAWCEHGPRMAVVAEVIVKDEAIKNLGKFKVER